MVGSHAAFSGSIPATYDACLGPLLFEFSAADLAERLAARAPTGPVLEIACGTGIATKHLRGTLPASVEIVATDLNPGMLDFAKTHRGSLPGVRWEQADAMALPYPQNTFDAVVCQFGIMFFPDIARGLSEMLRVLRPGGFAACNVWDTFDANRVAGIAHETIAGYFESAPPSFLRVPFGSCSRDSTLALFRSQGFDGMESHVVDAVIERPSAIEVARGFVEGNPGILEIHERATAGPETIAEAVAEKLEKAFGPPPLRIPLREIVFTGRVPSGD